jgi:alcohol dehydrogenase class IV
LPNAARHLAGWARQQGLPGLRDMGIDATAQAKAAEAASSSSSMKANPVPLSADSLRSIMEQAG